MDDRELKEALNVASHTNYTNPYYLYLKNVNITEWDIHSAGLSVLKFRKLLPEKEIKKLESLDKHSRTVKEGLLQRDNPKIAEEIINTLTKARQGFVLLNKIPADSILSIKKDALFLINQNPQQAIVKEYFEFRKKGTYTSYLNLGKKEFYYNSLTNELETKGIPSDGLKYQKDYILKDIKGFLRSGEKIQPDQLFTILQNYQNKYLSKSLPIETYRELNTGMFRLDGFLMEAIGETEIARLDITQNYMNYILPLIQAML